MTAIAEHDDDRIRLRFETLLTDISARFVGVSSDEIDAEIHAALHRIGEFFRCDRCGLLKIFRSPRQIVRVTHAWNAPGIATVSGDIDLVSLFPWSYEKVVNGLPCAVADIHLAPPEAAVDYQSWQVMGVRSTLSIPLYCGVSVEYIAVMQMMSEPFEWPERYISRIRLLGEVFLHALERRASEEALRNSEERLRLAAASAGAGLWTLDYVSGILWGTPKAFEIIGRAYDPNLTFDAFLRIVHPEDREKLRLLVEKSRHADEEIRAEYRILCRDDTVRSVQVCGRPQFTAGGKPRCLMGVLIDVTDRINAAEQLRESLDEVQRLRDQLQHENLHLREQIRSDSGKGAIVGESKLISDMLANARRVAPADSVVLITGETGTGKELLAEAIHEMSPRGRKPIVKVNCAALPATLIESELFGREKGAYTGAMTQQVGRFELAHGSTLFLDEIGELPQELQPKLLRVLQEGRFERLGGNKTISVDVRIIAATNRDLAAMVADGRFRSDLFYRLNVFPIDVPPLRLRPDDIPQLTWRFVRHFAQKMGRSIDSIPRQTMQRLQNYHWPGNIRELRNLVERAVILSDGKILRIEVPTVEFQRGTAAETLEDVERRRIIEALEQSAWRVGGRNGAAIKLGVIRTTLQSKIKKLGITRPHA